MRLRSYLHLPVVGLLLTSGLFKSLELLDAPFFSVLGFESRLLSTLVILVELSVAWWMLSGFLGNAAKAVSIVLFSLFLVISILNWVNGNTHCGCFGRLQVPPLATILLDCSAIVAIAFWSPAKLRLRGHLVPIAWVGSFSLVLLIAFSREVKSGVVPDIDSRNAFVVLDFNNWKGRRFELSDKLVSQRSATAPKLLQQGDWRVYIYDENCRKCSRLIQSELLNPNTGSAVAFVSLRPTTHKRDDFKQVRFFEPAVGNDWFSDTPVELELNDGMVQSVRFR